MQQALIIFDALSQETRLRAFKLLVRAGDKGLPAGQISEELNTPHNTMSFHLTHLANAGIVSSHREGRSIFYRANYTLMNELIKFTVENCCCDEFAAIHEDRKKGCSIIELAKCC